MASGRVLTGMLLIGALAVTPGIAEAQRQRDRSERREDQVQRQERRIQPQERRSDWQQQRELQRRVDVERRIDTQRRINAQRQWNARRGHDSRRVYTRPYYSDGRYRRPVVIIPRVVRPRVVTVVPYRPYFYRPRLSLGVLYGSGGAYPYGYTPRGYYDPIPGRLYGGLRIKDAPHEAQVFADGYYVGIVDDFDGVFQHLNLEAGPHSIEVRVPGIDEAITFDVVIQPGRTITYRADW
jgi:hypothetical protein